MSPLDQCWAATADAARETFGDGIVIGFGTGVVVGIVIVFVISAVFRTGWVP